MLWARKALRMAVNDRGLPPRKGFSEGHSEGCRAMSVVTLVQLAFAICCFVLAGSSAKAWAMAPDTGRLLITLALYTIGNLVMLRLIRAMGMAVALSVSNVLQLVAVNVVALAFYGERLGFRARRRRRSRGCRGRADHARSFAAVRHGTHGCNLRPRANVGKPSQDGPVPWLPALPCWFQRCLALATGTEASAAATQNANVHRHHRAHLSRAAVAEAATTVPYRGLTVTRPPAAETAPDDQESLSGRPGPL